MSQRTTGAGRFLLLILALVIFQGVVSAGISFGVLLVLIPLGVVIQGTIESLLLFLGISAAIFIVSYIISFNFVIKGRVRT